MPTSLSYSSLVNEVIILSNLAGTKAQHACDSNSTPQRAASILFIDYRRWFAKADLVGLTCFVSCNQDVMLSNMNQGQAFFQYSTVFWQWKNGGSLLWLAFLLLYTFYKRYFQIFRGVTAFSCAFVNLYMGVDL